MPITSLSSQSPQVKLRVPQQVFAPVYTRDHGNQEADIAGLWERSAGIAHDEDDYRRLFRRHAVMVLSAEPIYGAQGAPR